MRLQSFLSRAGVMSRRAIVSEIERGNVTVNGTVIRLPSHPVFPENDRIFYRAREVKFHPLKYFIFHKPKGVVTTVEDAHGRKTVINFFPHVKERIYPVGRLDRNTTGLLLLTNDGELTYRLTHPKFGVKKIYNVVLAEPVSEEKIRELEKGIWIEGYKTAPCEISGARHQDAMARWCLAPKLQVTLHEGRKRQIRVMFDSIGCKVLELHRKQYGPLTLKGLPLGQSRELTRQEVEWLKAAVKNQERPQK